VAPAGPDAVQGFSLVMGYDCAQLAAVEAFDITDTILEAVSTEFIGVHADNDAAAYDVGCSLVLGVLLDAVPPFEGQVIPGLPMPQALGLLSFQIRTAVACDATLTVKAADGKRGRGNTPVFNLVSIDNYAYPASLRPFSVCATREARFYRGDCNFSLRQPFTYLVDPVEIADAAAVISSLFRTSIFRFNPPCRDACDANDDGRIDLADAVGILYFLFVPGTPLLPPPYPGFDGAAWPSIVRVGPGVDPTEDPLDCVAGTDCAIE